MDKFIAALDQSGGSVDRTLSLYGVEYDNYNRYELINSFKQRVFKSNCFNNSKIFGVIISKDMIKDKTVKCLKEKGFKIFVKIDEGLEDENNGVRLLKQFSDLDKNLDKLNIMGIYGTKMRSLILEDNEEGIRKVVKNQFDIAHKIYSKGLIPIIEPEISINAENKENCERILKQELLNNMNDDIKFILKLTLPEINNYYEELNFNKNLLYLTFLSGGYSKKESIKRLSRNKGVACFSRVLLEGLKTYQSDEEFERVLFKNIDDIYKGGKYEKDKD